VNFYTADELHKIGFKSVHNSVLISRSAQIYGASRITIGENSRIDDFCVISAGEGGIYIGRNVHIAVMCTVMGKSKIMLSDFCGLSSRVSIYSTSDDYSGKSLTNPTIPDKYKTMDNREVLLEKHVIVGSGTILLPGTRIGIGSAVGALSLVGGVLEPFTIFAGVPAKKVKKRCTRLIELEKEFIASNA
jgi:dTDP-4-amino-4,6-dideoxy-D-glucose acyltransferase